MILLLHNWYPRVGGEKNNLTFACVFTCMGQSIYIYICVSSRKGYPWEHKQSYSLLSGLQITQRNLQTMCPMFLDWQSLEQIWTQYFRRNVAPSQLISLGTEISQFHIWMTQLYCVVQYKKNKLNISNNRSQKSKKLHFFAICDFFDLFFYV